MVFVCNDEVDAPVVVRLGCGGRRLRSGTGAGESEDTELPGDAGKYPAALVMVEPEQTELVLEIGENGSGPGAIAAGLRGTAGGLDGWKEGRAAAEREWGIRFTRER